MHAWGFPRNRDAILGGGGGGGLCTEDLGIYDS